MSNKALGILIATMVGFTSLALSIWLYARNPGVNASISTASKPSAIRQTIHEEVLNSSGSPSEPQVPKYRVLVDTVGFDTPLRTQVKIHVFIEEHVTEVKLRQLLDHLYEVAKKRGPFEHRSNPNFIWLRIHARRGQGWIAQGRQTSESEFQVDVRTRLLDSVNDPPVERFGRSEADRQMIYRDIIRVERRSKSEAEQLYPWPLPESDPAYTESRDQAQLRMQSETDDELLKKYMDELAELLELTVGELDQIGNEGVNNLWNVPAPTE